MRTPSASCTRSSPHEHVEDAKLKGISRVVPVYRVQSEVKPVRSLLIKGQGDIVGRRGELGRLLRGGGAVHHRLRARVRHLGRGRHRQVPPVQHAWSRRPRRGARGRCTASATRTRRSPPSSPGRRCWCRCSSCTRASELEARLERIRREFEGLEDVGPEWVPVLASIMGLPVAGGASSPQALDARQKNQQVFHIVHQLLVKRSQVARRCCSSSRICTGRTASRWI